MDGSHTHTHTLYNTVGLPAMRHKGIGTDTLTRKWIVVVSRSFWLWDGYGCYMLLLAFNLIVNRPSQESGCVVCVCQSWGKSKEGRKDESGRKGQKKVARRIVEKRKRDAMVDRWRRNRISLLSPPDLLLLLTPTPTKIKRQVGGGSKSQSDIQHETGGAMSAPYSPCFCQVSRFN